MVCGVSHGDCIIKRRPRWQAYQREGSSTIVIIPVAGVKGVARFARGVVLEDLELLEGRFDPALEVSLGRYAETLRGSRMLRERVLYRFPAVLRFFADYRAEADFKHENLAAERPPYAAVTPARQNCARPVLPQFEFRILKAP